MGILLENLTYKWAMLLALGGEKDED